MPYKSKSQERWAHTESGEKALGKEGVNEWDQASKGKKLPEKAPKMADGGIVDALKNHLESIYGNLKAGKPGIEEPTLDGLQIMADKAAGKDPAGPHYDPMAGKEIEKPENEEGPYLGAEGGNGYLDAEAGYTKKFSDGGIIDSIKHLLGRDKTESSQADQIEPIVTAPQASTDTPKGYDDGGVVPDGSVMDMNADDPDIYKAKTPNPMDTPSAQPVPTSVPSFNPHAGLAPHLNNPNVPPAPSPVVQSDPSGLASYIAQQKSQAGAYGPQQQQELEKAILARQNSVQGRVANAGAGLADALLSAGGKQPVNFQGNLQAKENEQGKQALETQKTANEENRTNLQEQMALTAKDPMSALSKSAQSSYGPLLKQMGATSQQIAAMPADLIGEVAAKNITLDEAIARIDETKLYHQLMAGQQAANLSEKERENEVEHPIGTLLHGLGQKIAGGTSESSAPVIPAGRVTVVSPDGKIGHIPQSQLQEAIKAGYKPQ